jgi:hypothetical protein
MVRVQPGLSFSSCRSRWARRCSGALRLVLKSAQVASYSLPLRSSWYPIFSRVGDGEDGLLHIRRLEHVAEPLQLRGPGLCDLGAVPDDIVGGLDVQNLHACQPPSSSKGNSTHVARGAPEVI